MAETLTAPTVPEVAPAAAKPASPASVSPMNDAFSDLDTMFNAAPKSSNGLEGTAAGDDAPPPDKEPPVPAVPKVEPGAQKSPPVSPTKPAGDVPIEKMAPRQLREAYQQAKTRLAEMEKQVAEAKKNATPTEHPEFKTLQERLAEREKRLEDVQKELEFTAFERSERFKETYEKPYHRAWNLGRTWVSNITVNDPQTGESRQGTPQDFDAVMQLSAQSPDQAAELMDQLFGSKASSVSPYMAKVNENLQNMQEALKEARDKGVSRDKEFTERTSKQQGEIREHIEKSWKRFQGEAIEKFPQWFKPVEGDEEANAALQKGFEQATRAFSRLNAADPNLSPEEREKVVASHAALFNKAAAFPKLVVQLKQRESRIAALEEELKAFRASAPGAGGGGPRQATVGSDGWESQLDKLAR